MMIYFSALFLGLAHAFEADHLAAVTAFVAEKPRWKESWQFGAKWALGHALSLFLAGSVLYAIKSNIPESWAVQLEQLVGIFLIVLGLWIIFKIFVLKKKAITHLHYGALGMGVLHGLAGSAAFVAESVVVFSKSYAAVVFFTGSFSIGVLLAMTAYSAISGQFLTLVLRRVSIHKYAQLAAAGFALVIGIQKTFI